jgi:hypothetical protein
VSKHVWEVQRYTRATLYAALDAVQAAKAGGCNDADEVCRFVGYWLETMRQKSTTQFGIVPSGHLPAFVMTKTGFRYYTITASHCWAGAVKSKHRYARGHNRDNYLAAGARAVEQAAAMYGGFAGPYPVALDWLEERGFKLPAEPEDSRLL